MHPLAPMYLGITSFIIANLGLVLGAPAINYNIIVGSKLQEIDGFGISQAFGRANQFFAQPPTPQKQGLDYLFSTSTGAGFSIIRNRIGSKGAGDSILPTSPGSPTGTPQYAWDGNDTSQVWFSQQAMSYGVKTIYADAWSAPGFMKTNGNEANGGYLCGVDGETCSSGDWRQAYANMLVQYIQYYAQTGIPVSHVGFLNEPDFTATYSSMLSSGTQAASFIPVLYSTLAAAGFGNVSLTCCDATGWSAQNTMTSQLVAAGMEQYLSVITSHAYSSDPNSIMGTKLKVWETEAADLNDHLSTTWYSSGAAVEGMTWANKIHTGLTAANLSAYLYWEGLEENNPPAASGLINSDGTTVTPSAILWAFAMWSRFVRPGAFRISASGIITNVGISAFLNVDGSVVLVFVNNNSASEGATTILSGFIPSSATAFLTDNTHQVAPTTVNLVDGLIMVTIPSRAILTVIVVGSVAMPTTTATIATTATITTTLATTTTPSSSPSPLATHYSQCGGISWPGATVCVSPYVCTVLNPYFSQCL